MEMSVPLVASGGDDEVHVEKLQLCIGRFNRTNGKLDFVIAERCAGDEISGSADAVGPLLLIGAQLPTLVIHFLKKVLNQVKPYDTIVCGSGTGNNLSPALQWALVEVVDIIRVEDRVYTVGLPC